MKVSVVILTWNSASSIEACLASLPAGLTVGHEVIVVDNGSRDQTVSLLRDQLSRMFSIIAKTRKTVGLRRRGIRVSGTRSRRIHPHPG